MLEAPTANVWWREGDRLLTPALELPVLAGVTRAALSSSRPRPATRSSEGTFPLERLLAADEVFLSSSIREVMPVVAVDGSPVGPGVPGRRRRAPARPARGCGGGLPSGAMSEEKIRLGGMALANGVLVHGPTSWACAIRHPDGEIEVASARKRFRAANGARPLLRGPCPPRRGARRASRGEA